MLRVDVIKLRDALLKGLVLLNGDAGLGFVYRLTAFVRRELVVHLLERRLRHLLQLELLELHFLVVSEDGVLQQSGFLHRPTDVLLPSSVGRLLHLLLNDLSMLNKSTWVRLHQSLPLSVVDAHRVLPVLLAAAVDLVLQPVKAILSFLESRLQGYRI